MSGIFFPPSSQLTGNRYRFCTDFVEFPRCRTQDAIIGPLYPSPLTKPILSSRILEDEQRVERQHNLIANYLALDELGLVQNKIFNLGEFISHVDFHPIVCCSEVQNRRQRHNVLFFLKLNIFEKTFVVLSSKLLVRATKNENLKTLS